MYVVDDYNIIIYKNKNSVGIAVGKLKDNKIFPLTNTDRDQAIKLGLDINKPSISKINSS